MTPDEDETSSPGLTTLFVAIEILVVNFIVAGMRLSLPNVVAMAVLGGGAALVIFSKKTKS